MDCLSSPGFHLDLTGDKFGILVQLHPEAVVAVTHDWLRIEFGIEKPSQRLQSLADLDADGLIAEVKKLRGRKAPLTVADMKRLRVEHAASVLTRQTLAWEADGFEWQAPDLVNEDDGLTPDDVRLMWETVPPRMPFLPPVCPLRIPCHFSAGNEWG
jgi:hypothetical protein